MDRALPENVRADLGFVEGFTDNGPIKNCLLDCGSLVELISPRTAARLALVILKACPPLTLRMADGSTADVTDYVVFPLVLDGIVSMVRAWLTGQNDAYDLLLSR